MPNSWDRDVHPVKPRKQKPKIMQTCKNKRIANDVAMQKMKEHVEAYEFVDKNESRAKLFPSSVIGNTDKSYQKQIRGLLKFCMLMQDWSSAITLDSN